MCILGTGIRQTVVLIMCGHDVDVFPEPKGAAYAAIFNLVFSR